MDDKQMKGIFNCVKKTHFQGMKLERLALILLGILINNFLNSMFNSSSDDFYLLKSFREIALESIKSLELVFE